MKRKRKHKTKSKAKALPLLVEPDEYEPPCASCCQHGCSGCSSKPPKSPHVRRKVSRVPSGAEITKEKQTQRRAGKKRSLRRSAAAAAL